MQCSGSEFKWELQKWVFIGLLKFHYIILYMHIFTHITIHTNNIITKKKK